MRFALEMHLVHFNSEYEKIMDAVRSERGGGLAVVSVLFEVSAVDNMALEPIMKASRKIRKHDAEVKDKEGDITLADLLPRSAESSFYTYNGSWQNLHYYDHILEQLQE